MNRRTRSGLSVGRQNAPTSWASFAFVSGTNTMLPATAQSGARWDGDMVMARLVSTRAAISLKLLNTGTSWASMPHDVKARCKNAA